MHKLPEEQQRWYAIKIFERDDKVLAKLHIPEDVHAHIEADIKAAEEELDDDAESIITNERYVYIAEVIRACYRKKSKATHCHQPLAGPADLRRGHVPRLLGRHGRRRRARDRLGQ